MFKTINELIDETGYDFDEGAKRTQYAKGKRWRLINSTLFVSEALLSDWVIYAKVVELQPQYDPTLSA
ncbi:MAG: hypothetical protein M1300_07565 [Epsilonproteobacteria bacterium]|nr:hypothetical protein [Campylobacterota bacterium]